MKILSTHLILGRGIILGNTNTRVSNIQMMVSSGVSHGYQFVRKISREIISVTNCSRNIFFVTCGFFCETHPRSNDCCKCFLIIRVDISEVIFCTISYSTYVPNWQLQPFSMLRALSGDIYRFRTTRIRINFSRKLYSL